MQLLLNNPDRTGGSSALDLNADNGVLGSVNAARLALNFADLNQMLSELYVMFRVGEGLEIPFSQTIPLVNVCYMPAQSVIGPLAFTPGANPSVYGRCSVRLTADGVHVPTFDPSFQQNGSWVSTAGAVNELVFEYGAGVAGGATLTMGQEGALQANPITCPSVASLSIVHGTNPTLVIETGGTALNRLAAPAGAAFTITTTQGATIAPSGSGVPAITVAANAISIQLQGSVAPGDSVVVSYTPPTLNSALSARAGEPVQDVNGNLLAAITGATATVS